MRCVGSQAAPCPQGSDPFCLEVALAFIHLMTLLGGTLCQFPVSACQKWPTVVFRSMYHCSLRWLCWARCWMLQVMDNMEGSCVFYVKVSTFTTLEQSITTLLTVNQWGIVRLIVGHDLIGSGSFLYYCEDYLRQTSDQHIANPGTVGNPGNLPLYAAGFILSITIILAA